MDKLSYFETESIYALTGEDFSRGRTNLEVVRAMLAGGIRVVQYREKMKDARSMYEECMEIRRLTREQGALFLVNDHIDLAMAVDADGVHIGQSDLPPAVVRKLIGDDKVLGLSTHNPEEAREAEALGCIDYIGVGPIFATKTKADALQPIGYDNLAAVRAAVSLPIVAIGGIKEDKVADVLQKGASMTAIISDIVADDNIAEKCRRLVLSNKKI
ncbi:MAG: thiamine phosphate synthase [Selenomonadales bacterium]|nr:thiamine phosphate synthase [Selenomonadales bacterium]